MNPLTISALGPVTFGALSAPRPVPAPAVPAQSGNAPGATALSIQDLAQTLFQRSLQAATLFPVAAPVVENVGLAQDATASLLAALTAPQAAASATLTAGATTTPGVATSPAAVQAAGAPTTTAPPPAPPTSVLADLPANQDAFATSLSPDFALQTALRFGAGVAAQVAPGVLAGDLGAGLVRDAARVPRLGNLQPHAGGPGPEAYTQPQATLERVLRTYQAIPAPQGSVGLDLMA